MVECCAHSGAAEREGLAAVFHQPHLDGCAGRAATPPQWHLHPNTRADVDQVRVAALECRIDTLRAMTVSLSQRVG